MRESVLDAGEVERLRDAVEETSARVIAHATRDGAGPLRTLGDGRRIQMSSRTSIQWEWREGSQEIRLCEPCDHLHDAFAEVFADERLAAPAASALGLDEVTLFTTKLNLKRAEEGSEFPWHQDFPYWYSAVGWEAADVVTEIVFLDDAYAGNGALRVAPGSHRNGPDPRDPDDPTRFLADPAKIDDDREVVVEVPAGSMILFGAFLAHRSSPNTSGAHRRALLPSYQAVGRPRLFSQPYVPGAGRRLP